MPPTNLEYELYFNRHTFELKSLSEQDGEWWSTDYRQSYVLEQFAHHLGFDIFVTNSDGVVFFQPPPPLMKDKNEAI